MGHLIQFSFGVATAVIATQKGPNRKSENARAVLTCVFFLGKGNGVSEIGAGGLSERKKTLPYGLCTQCLFPPRGVKNVFSVFFWSRIRTEIRAFFWPWPWRISRISVRLSVFPCSAVLLAAFWTARAMRRQHAMRTCHHHVPPPRRGRLPARSAVYSSSPLYLPTKRTGNQARTARAPAIEQGNSGNGGNGGGRGELTAIY